MKYYFANVNLSNVFGHQKLNSIMELIDVFKELNGEECLESTDIQNTTRHTKLESEDETHEFASHNKTVTFRLRLPFVFDELGRPTSPFSTIGKMFDDFVKLRRTSRTAEDIKLEQEIFESYRKLMAIEKTYYPGTIVRQLWGKDKPID